MNQPAQKAAVASITGTFYIHFLDGMPPNPLQKADRLDISAEEVVILRGDEVVDRLVVDADSTNRWGRAQSSTLVIEYLKYDHAGRTGLLFGRMGRNSPGFPNEDPPVGVWGADSQPPKGGGGQG